jgi:hypothetical protein
MRRRSGSVWPPPNDVPGSPGPGIPGAARGRGEPARHKDRGHPSGHQDGVRRARRTVRSCPRAEACAGRGTGSGRPGMPPGEARAGLAGVAVRRTRPASLPCIVREETGRLLLCRCHRAAPRGGVTRDRAAVRATCAAARARNR